MKFLLHLVYILVRVRVSELVDFCPSLCHCHREVFSVSCFGAEIFPQFHCGTMEVWLIGTKLTSIPQDAFSHLINVSHIFISDDDSLRFLEKHSFSNLNRLTHVQLTGLKSLSVIDPEAFKNLPNLKYLGISNTGLTTFPALHFIQSQQDEFILEIVENLFIEVIPANSFTGISDSPLTAMLNSNGVKTIQNFAFNGSSLEEVYLYRNLDLTHIDEYAFHGVIHGPTHLDLSETRVESLPSLGLQSVERLRLRNTWSLRVLPSFRVFLHLQSAELTFPSHCCGLTKLRPWRGDSEALICNQTWSDVINVQESFSSSSQRRQKTLKHVTDSFGLVASGRKDHKDDDVFCPLKNCQSDVVFYMELPMDQATEAFDFSLCGDVHSDRLWCLPLPDALNPCEDVIGHRFLQVLVWFVSLSAILANLLVMFILLTSRQKMSVTRFLIGHLAFADFCMGIYLLLIASVDVYTRSVYYQFAISWQTGSGCNLAGTLSMFASELSVYTLTVISLQRWHTIFYAMRPDRKIRLRHAATLMLVGWFLCGVLALFPVFGVSSYQRVSICLPMDTETAAARTYVVSVLMANVLAFMVVCLCYLHIYCMVHNPQHLSSREDTSMAKRMAILIFTNFLCLVPICFYGLSAALHQPLITITDSKVLLVLFYPLNSCAHPFFYAILTKAFHRDVLTLLSQMGLCTQKAHLFRSQFYCQQLQREKSPPDVSKTTTVEKSQGGRISEITSGSLIPSPAAARLPELSHTPTCFCK